jgi:regulator of sirC expression with transglutaminase-like and TPR domain
MKISKAKLRQIIKEELATEWLSGTDKENLVSRVKKLLMHSLIDEEGVATLTRVVHELEGLYPVAHESETEDWTKPRGSSHFRR